MRHVSMDERVFAAAETLMGGQHLAEYKEAWFGRGQHDPYPCPRCFAAGETGSLMAANKKDPVQYEGELICRQCRFEIDLDR